MIKKVLHRKQTTNFFTVGNYFTSDFTAIESVPSLFREELITVGQFGQAKDFTKSRWSLAINKVCSGRPRIGCQ